MKKKKKQARATHEGKGRIGIKAKLTIGFAIPLIITIIIGIVSYSLAASGMTDNYEESMSKALSMATEYLDFGFESAIAESEQLYYNTDLVRWATGAIYNEWTKQQIQDEVRLDLGIRRECNSFMSNIYIIPQEEMPMVSTSEEGEIIPGFYKSLLENPEGNCLETLKGNWIGVHPYIDGVLSQADASYSASSYACSYIRPMATRRACIVIDYQSEAIADVLRNLDLGEDSISAFVTADGREILLRGNEVTTNDDFSFTSQSYFTEAMADNAAIIIDYVPYEGSTYLFMISKSHSNGSALCAMVPVKQVNAMANSIRNITVLMLILALIIVTLAGVYIIMGIVSTIRHLSTRLETVAGGDLTVDISTSRKDEFRILVKSIANMIRNSRDLIVQVRETTKAVSVSTDNLAEAAETLDNSNSQIAESVSEMDRGLSQQSENSQNCLELMDELSSRITLAVDSVKEINALIESTQANIDDGMSTMDDLSSKSSDTSNITEQVIANVKTLGGSLGVIGQFVETINEIATETNLLSLNASIEAARAGEAGKGFAVVAQSVSKLSDNTIQAADHIRETMEQIKHNADEAVNASIQAGEIVSKQTETVSETIHVFRSINEDVENILVQISSLNDAIESMERHRNDTLQAIESISSVSEENAASISLVNDSLKEQLTIVDNLHDSMKDLEEKAEMLTQAVNAFKL